jgi:heavy metal sensor kinase
MLSGIPIRIRLTVWYSLFLTGALILFTIISIWLMRHSINVTVDEQLMDEAKAVQALVGGANNFALHDQVRAHAELQAGSSLIQVADENGDFVYRSPRLQALNFPITYPQKRQFMTVKSGGSPLRAYSIKTVSSGRTFTIQVAEDMDDYFDALGRYRLFLWIGIPLLLIAATVGGHWMSRRALRPVDEITRAAKEISPTDLAARVVVPGTRDEIESLARTLNAMLQRIQSAFEQMKQFTADASHDLRTPIAFIQTRAEVALRKPRTDYEYREALNEIFDETRRLSGLIENLLLLARTDVATEGIKLEKINLCDVARDAGAQGKTLAESRHIEWSQNLPESSLWIRGDTDALRRLFLILIDNAIKYTPEHGSVGVGVGTLDGKAYLEVLDSGIGIAEKDLPHIFNRFYRADSARSRDSGGFGLGLSIGQWIAKAHQGTITVKTALGQGSSLQVWLPLID